MLSAYTRTDKNQLWPMPFGVIIAADVREKIHFQTVALLLLTTNQCHVSTLNQ
jgi:hypothetical protein